jgi:flagellar assembly factor FliW
MKEINLKKIKNIFGETEVNLDNKIYFLEGIIGFPKKTHFCLAELTKNHPFKILQCIEHENITFLVLPILKNNNENYSIYNSEDIKTMQTELGIEEQNTIILLIVNVKLEEDGKNEYFVNARGPLVIDLENKKGVQYVFNNNKYSFQYHLEIPIKTLNS